MLLRIVSPFIWVYIALSSVPLFLVAVLIWAVTTPFDRNRRLLHLYTCFWAAQYFYVNPIWRLRVEGAGKVDRRAAYVLVANHQSLVDILAIHGTYLPFKWVSKASIFKLPLIGWNCTLNGYVPLVRGHKGSIEDMYLACRRWLSRGVSVCMFPEGTRSSDGQIKDFKVGAFRIAREAGCQVLPVVVDGTGNALPKHGFVLRNFCRATVRVLEPVDVSRYPTHEAASDAVRALMIAELDRLRGQTARQAA